MKITNNMDVNKPLDVNAKAAQVNQQKEQSKKTVSQTPKRVIEVSLTAEQDRKKVLSDEELKCAIENIISSQSGIYDVQQADEMIREANKRILANSGDAVLAQANQTPPMVTELTQ